MHSGCRALGLLVLVALAGCSALGPTHTTTGGPPTAPSNRTTLPAESPPGVTNGTLAHPIALVDAHLAVLKRSSYTSQWNETVTARNGSVVYRQRRRAQVGAHGHRFHTRSAVAARRGTNVFLGESNGSVEVWSNGTVAVSVVHAGTRTRYVNATRLLSNHVATGDRLYVLLTATEPTVSRASAPESTALVLRADHAPADRRESIANRFDPHPITNVSNVSFRAVVRPSGLVESYSLAYEARWRNQTVRVAEGAAFTRLNETTVTRPAWVATAVNRTRGGQTSQSESASVRHTSYPRRYASRASPRRRVRRGTPVRARKPASVPVARIKTSARDRSRALRPLV